MVSGVLYIFMICYTVIPCYTNHFDRENGDEPLDCRGTPFFLHCFDKVTAMDCGDGELCQRELRCHSTL